MNDAQKKFVISVVYITLVCLNGVACAFGVKTLVDCYKSMK